MSSERFDYVIVGGGLAGLVVASRLAEDLSSSVAVIEAGTDASQDINVKIPGFLVNNLGNPALDWAFFSSPQKGADDRAVYLPRGKGLGGSSIINFMQLGRASSLEYDAFETLGCKGWNWEEFLEYFRKSETFNYTSEVAQKYRMDITQNAHGTSGPLQKGLPIWTSVVSEHFIEAMQSLGVPHNGDNNDGDNVGIGTNTMSIDTEATRCSSASAYYEPVKNQSNLTVITNARATRIVFGPQDTSGEIIAEGVEYSQDGRLEIIYANKKVVLCTGTYQTPQLLELSGIGDANILKSHHIPVVVNLPGVGTNLRTSNPTALTMTVLPIDNRSDLLLVHKRWAEHVICAFTAEMDSKHDSFDALADPERAAEELQKYETTRKGLLSSVPSAFAFLPLKYFTEDDTILEAGQSLNLDHLTDVTPGMRKVFSLQKEWLANDKVSFLEMACVDRFLPGLDAKPELGKAYLSMSIILLHPFSRGTVHIGSANPMDHPIIDPRFLDNDVDISILLNAYKLARKVISTDALRSDIIQEISPGPKFQSDEEMISYIKSTMGSTHHPIGTAAMLNRDDGGVVDSKLKVYGTSNLHVVDASVIPIQLSAHLQATVYALAEKAVNILKSA